MATTTPVTAARYNALRDTVNRVLGVSSPLTPTYGYGNFTSTSAVVGNFEDNGTNADKIAALEYEEIYFDLLRARIHQLGADNVTVLPYPEGDFNNNPSADIVDETYIQLLETLASNIETDRFSIDAESQASTSSVFNQQSASISSVYDQSARGTWNGQLIHIFDVSFQNAADRRHFFNAGGEIRVDAAVNYSGSQAKSVDWATRLNDLDSYSIAGNRSFIGNSTAFFTNKNTSVGNYALTGSYQQLYFYAFSNAYVNNYYAIQALSLNDTTVRVRVSFVDGEAVSSPPPDTPIDEAVFGDFSSNVSVLIPDGSATINGVVTDTVVYDGSIVGTLISGL